MALCTEGGLSYADFLLMNMVEIRYHLRVVGKREIKRINDMLYANQDLASLIGLSVWGSDKFPKEVRRVDDKPKKAPQATDWKQQLRDWKLAQHLALGGG